ncbi:MAG: hypothetical protein ABIX01_19395 [Chitinophagaceae bacterium]
MRKYRAVITMLLLVASIGVGRQALSNGLSKNKSCCEKMGGKCADKSIVADPDEISGGGDPTTSNIDLLHDLPFSTF